MPELPAETVVPSPWMNKREAARYARMSVGTITRAILDGHLKASGGGKPGAARVVVHVEDLEEWLRNR